MKVTQPNYGHCSNIIKFFNDAYDNYKSKKVKHKIKNCITKIHSYSVDTLNIKIPNHTSFPLDIDKDDNIYLPLSFVISNLNQPQFTQKIPNDYAFKVLQLILSMLEDYNMFQNAKSKSRKLLGDIKVFSNIANVMQFGTYKFTIPKKLQVTFNIKGLDLATLNVKKLYKLKKNKNITK